MGCRPGEIELVTVPAEVDALNRSFDEADRALGRGGDAQAR